MTNKHTRGRWSQGWKEPLCRHSLKQSECAQCFNENGIPVDAYLNALRENEKTKSDRLHLDVIYLIDTGDEIAWCDCPDPTGYEDPKDATKYLRSTPVRESAPELLAELQTAHLYMSIQWENANRRREKSRSNATAAAAQADADEINKVRKRLGAALAKARGES